MGARNALAEAEESPLNLRGPEPSEQDRERHERDHIPPAIEPSDLIHVVLQANSVAWGSRLEIGSANGPSLGRRRAAHAEKGVFSAVAIAAAKAL